MNTLFAGWKLNLKLLAVPAVIFAIGVAVPGLMGRALLRHNAERELSEKAQALSRAYETIAAAASLAKPAPGSAACQLEQHLRAASRARESGFTGGQYRYRIVAANPTNRQHAASEYESRLLAAFEADKNLGQINQIARLEGGEFQVVARAIRMNQESCVRCHTAPELAPPARIAQYGKKAGFGWHRGQTVGASVIYVPREPALQQADSIFNTLLQICALLAVLCMGMMVWRVRSVVALPLQKLLETARALRRGDWKATYRHEGLADEIGDIAHTLEDTTRWLREQLVREEKTRALFQQFIPASVGARALGTNPDSVIQGSQHPVTVMVINIRNFKLLMANLPPHETITTLNQFFSEVNKVIVAHNGMVSKYLGDTVMAFFGMPISADNHALNAVKAALALPRALQDLYVRLDEKHGWELGIGVGISTGEPIVGQFGSSEHYEYTVLGDVVGDAHRLEYVTKGIPEEDSILISESTYRLVMSDVHVFDLGEKPIRDGSLVRAFAVQGLRSEVRSAISPEPALAAKF